VYLCKKYCDTFKPNDLYPKMRFLIIAGAILMNVCGNAVAQTTSIKDGVINKYARVSQIEGKMVTLSSIDDANKMFGASWQAGCCDTVLIIQMTGIPVHGNTVNNAGRYEFHKVTHVSGNTVTLESAIVEKPDHTGKLVMPFNPGTEIVQMVLVRSYKNAIVDKVLTCDPFNWASGKGGVLALFVHDSLTLKADIDVSGRGFNGGKAYIKEYPANAPCSYNSEDGTDSFDYPEESELAGYKGEGAVSKSYFDAYPKGFRRAWNGGGGGNGKWSGGGGGANGNSAGDGDDQACGVLDDFYGDSIYHYRNRGQDIKYEQQDKEKKYWLYDEPSEYAFMGGGGGAGTGIGSPGGNGGGIVIIAAHKLRFEEDAMIKANGASVSGIVREAGAGGGGGGGSILLSSHDYGKNFNAKFKGGNGGSVYRDIIDCRDITGNYSRGAGGGGSGGILFVSKGTITDWLNDSIKKGGNMGKIISLEGGAERGICIGRAGNGLDGKIFGDFKIQLRGFYLNYIFTPDTTVCYGDEFNDFVVIRASQPQGIPDDKIPTYQWQYESNGLWYDIPETNTIHLTRKFTQNTRVRRIVSFDGIDDVSMPINIQVLSKFTNIIPKDITLCLDRSFTILGESPGDNFDYEWREIRGGRIHNDIIGRSKDLTVTRTVDKIEKYQFQRKVILRRYGCISLAETSVTVQPSIRNNVIYPNEQRLCEDKTPEKIVATNPTGGNGTIKHRWEVSLDKDNWKPVSNESEQYYQPTLPLPEISEPDLNKPRYYRRYIESGECTDESNAVEVQFERKPMIVKPSILPETTDQKNLVGKYALIFTTNFELEARLPDYGKGLWYSSDDVSFTSHKDLITTVYNLREGEIHTIYWEVDGNTCDTSLDSIQIELKTGKMYGISPNNDGFNDCFRIAGVKKASRYELIILDKSNKVVVKKTGSSLPDLENPSDKICLWDGKNNSGGELPAGVYFYQLIIDGDKVYKGYVVLKK